MKILVFIILTSSSAFAADSLLNKVGADICAANLKEKEKVERYKGLKIDQSKKLGVMCTMTANGTFTPCMAEMSKKYETLLPLKASEPRVARVEQAAVQFCKNFADMQSNGLVFSILEEAISSKITIDLAAQKIVGAYGPKK